MVIFLSSLFHICVSLSFLLERETDPAVTPCRNDSSANSYCFLTQPSQLFTSFIVSNTVLTQSVSFLPFSYYPYLPEKIIHLNRLNRFHQVIYLHAFDVKKYMPSPSRKKTVYPCRFRLKFLLKGETKFQHRPSTVQLCTQKKIKKK